MSPAEVLAEAARIGLSLHADGGRVVVRPARLLPPALAEAIRAKRREVLTLLECSPLCPACGAPVDDPEAVICGACYQARRGPGRVLAFDPDRRRRTEARLAGRACGTCAGAAWRVNARGDATCGRCFPDSSSTRSGSAPDAPAASKLAGPDRGGVSGGGAA